MMKLTILVCVALLGMVIATENEAPLNNENIINSRVISIYIKLKIYK